MKTNEAEIYALRIAERLRYGECPHGLPRMAVSKFSEGMFPAGSPFRPLCDACVIEAIKDQLTRK